MKNLFLIIILIPTIFISCGDFKKNVVNIYSKRHYQVDKDLFKEFEKKYNITVNVVKASADELIERIKTEGENCPADLIITVDAGKLQKAANEGLLEKVNYEDICKSLNPSLLDINNYWIPFTYRSRVLVYSKERVDVSDLSTYEDLISEKWKNKLLCRTSSNAYNQALLSSIIANHDEKFALDWANGVVKNFARNPKGNDRDQIRAIAANIGDIAIVNSYYLGLLISSEDSLDKKVAESVGVFFPNQKTNETGAHVNISGFGLLKNSPNKENAKLFMKFLTSEFSQSYYANNSFEYPANNNVPSSSVVSDWGDFRIDSLDLNKLGLYRTKAINVFEKSNWN